MKLLLIPLIFVTAIFAQPSSLLAQVIAPGSQGQTVSGQGSRVTGVFGADNQIANADSLKTDTTRNGENFKISISAQMQPKTEGTYMVMSPGGGLAPGQSVKGSFGITITVNNASKTAVLTGDTTTSSNSTMVFDCGEGMKVSLEGQGDVVPVIDDAAKIKALNPKQLVEEFLKNPISKNAFILWQWESQKDSKANGTADRGLSGASKTCLFCDGTGKSQVTGSTCRTCNGTGVDSAATKK